MTVEYIGMNYHSPGPESRPPGPMVLDRGFIRDFAQTAGAGGFNQILIGYFADDADGFVEGARKFAAHDQIAGGEDAEMLRDGDVPAQQQRYTGVRGNITSLLGMPQQVANALPPSAKQVVAATATGRAAAQ